MTFDDYQNKALTTAIKHPDPLMEKTIWAMGVAGEAGEIIEKWKKIVAYDGGKFNDKATLDDLSKEIADVVWYCAVFADSLGLSFGDIMQKNVEKLADRKKRNVLKGRGDNR